MSTEFQQHQQEPIKTSNGFSFCKRKEKEPLMQLSASQIQALEKHINENKYVCIKHICNYVEQTFEITCTNLELCEWLKNHDFSFKQTPNLSNHDADTDKLPIKPSLTLTQDNYSEKMAEFFHEINQPLTTIISYSRSCLLILKNKLNCQNLLDKLLFPLEKIGLQAIHMVNIMNNMKNFMAEGHLSVEETDINLLIKEALAILNHASFNYDLKITLNLAEELPLLSINKTYIMQVILNLARNSIESLQSTTNNDPELIIKTALSHQHIVVHVIDNGPGIPPQFKHKLFNGQFTTKSQGTGIGLRICRTLVEAHGGTLCVHQNEGAWFSFALPIKIPALV